MIGGGGGSCRVHGRMSVTKIAPRTPPKTHRLRQVGVEGGAEGEDGMEL